MSIRGTTGKEDDLGMTPEDGARLRAMTDEEIVARALSDPDAQPISPERLAAAREPAFAKQVRTRVRMGRETFAATYGIPLDTLIAWERGRTRLPHSDRPRTRDRPHPGARESRIAPRPRNSLHGGNEMTTIQIDLPDDVMRGVAEAFPDQPIAQDVERMLREAIADRDRRLSLMEQVRRIREMSPPTSNEEIRRLRHEGRP